jgi:hypothetical protein
MARIVYVSAGLLEIGGRSSAESWENDSSVCIGYKSRIYSWSATFYSLSTIFSVCRLSFHSPKLSELDLWSWCLAFARRPTMAG